MTEKRRVSRAGGCSTPRYRVIRGYFYPLVLTIEQDLPKLGTKLFAEALINDIDLENASNAHQPVYERAQALLVKIVKKIELVPTKFEVFVEVLREFSDIADDLISQLKKEEDCPYSIVDGSGIQTLSITEHSRRCFSESDAAKMKNFRSAEADSGFVMDTGFDNLLEGSDEECAGTPESKKTKHGPDSSFSDDMDDDCFQSPSAQTAQMPIPSEGTVPPYLPSFNFSGDFNQKMECTYLKSENKQLKDAIKRLEEEKESCAEEVIKQGHIINQKDDEIELLMKKCAEKDERVDSLEKDKVKMEKTIDDLRTQCLEARQEIKIAKESYESRIEALENSLKEIELSENEARIALADARAELAEAKCKKMEELANLREKYSKLQAIKNRLFYGQEVSLAMKDKEIAEHKAELAEKKAELAEMKIQEERRKSIELQEERKKSLEENKKLHKEIEKLRLNLVKNGD